MHGTERNTGRHREKQRGGTQSKTVSLERRRRMKWGGALAKNERTKEGREECSVSELTGILQTFDSVI